MSLLEKVDAPRAASEIEPGKRLIRVGDDRGLSLAERLTYGSTASPGGRRSTRLRLRGRYPLKLLAVPKDPVAGDKAAGEALLARPLRPRRRPRCRSRASISRPRPARGLRRLSAELRLAARPRRRGDARARRQARRGDHPQMARRPCRAGQRAGLARRSVGPAHPLLDRLRALHPVEPRLGLSLAACSTPRRAAPAISTRRRQGAAGPRPDHRLERGDRRRSASSRAGRRGSSRGEAGLLRALGAVAARRWRPGQPLADRAARRWSRLLGQLRAVYVAGAPRRARTGWPRRSPAAVGALLAVTLGDEALSSWQGGNMAARRAGSPRRSRAAGVARPAAPPGARLGLSAARRRRARSLVFDAAPPPPTRALRRRLRLDPRLRAVSDGPNRLVVNCGGAGDAAGALPAELVQALRTTAAHSTLTLGDRNSTAIHDDGSARQGRRRGRAGRATRPPASAVVEASHDGYVRRFGLVHQRQLTLAADGRELRGEDLLIPTGRRRRGRGRCPSRSASISRPASRWRPPPTARAPCCGCAARAVWQFRCRGGRLAIEDSLWIDGEARPHATSSSSSPAKRRPRA